MCARGYTGSGPPIDGEREWVLDNGQEDDQVTRMCDPGLGVFERGLRSFRVLGVL